MPNLRASEEMRELIETGRKCFESRNYARAEQCFLKILSLGGRYADVLNLLGIIYHVEGKFNESIEAFQKALEINPDYLETTLNLAVLYNDLGEYKKAKDLYVRLRKRKKTTSGLDPMVAGKIANVHAQLGDTYHGVKKFQEAIDEYKKALALCPAFADIRTKLGIAYREIGRNDLSVRELTAAVEANPSFNNARLQLGLAYYTMGRKEKAARVWKELLKKNGDDEIARVYLRLCGNSAEKKK